MKKTLGGGGLDRVTLLHLPPNDYTSLHYNFTSNVLVLFGDLIVK